MRLSRQDLLEGICPPATEGFLLARDSRSSETFMHGIKVFMDKNYIDNLSKETQKGMLEKAAQEIYPSFAPLERFSLRCRVAEWAEITSLRSP